jgi:hypothetical protein
MAKTITRVGNDERVAAGAENGEPEESLRATRSSLLQTNPGLTA